MLRQPIRTLPSAVAKGREGQSPCEELRSGDPLKAITNVAPPVRFLLP
jgi:hypothetical protein